jgi:hypothetical protein
MAIKVSKPSINLREKLSELDFDKVPFQKMPAGSVLQVVNGTMSGSFDSTSSGYQTVVALSISPKMSNSIFLITFTGALYPYTGTAGYSFSRKLTRDDLSNEIMAESYGWAWSNGSSQGERIWQTAWRNIDTNAHGTDTLTYTAHLNPNGARAYVYGGDRSLFTITEIAQ